MKRGGRERRKREEKERGGREGGIERREREEED